MFPLDALQLFIEQAQLILGGGARKGATAVMRFRDPVRSEKKHRWGGCLQCATFRGQVHKNKPTLTFYSRTTYMGYIGLLDAAIAYVLAREIGEPGLTQFRWVLTDMQLHAFKTLPFVFSQPDLFAQLNRFAKSRRGKPKSPTWKHLVNWYRKILAAYNEHGVDMLDLEKYGPFRRIKRRWLEHMRHVDKGAPPPLGVEELDFEKAI
jgi:hypothetical protein